jgi:hypothetical protein
MPSSQSAADKRLKVAALKCARKLDESCTAMNEFMRASFASGCPDERGAADSRRLLIESMSEYSTYLASVFDKKET